MKKALLIKIEAPSYSSIGLETAFKEYFDDVVSIDWQHIKFHLGIDGLWNNIIQKCDLLKPDIIFCQFQKSDILSVEQFKILSKYGFVINYTEDVREDTSWYEEVAPHIGLTVFTNGDDATKLSNKGIYNVAYMMVGYNDIWYRPVAKTKRDYGEIVFIGNNYENTNLEFPNATERQDMIKFMKSKFGNRFCAYGLGQEGGILSPAECVEAYNNCKIAVTQNNFTRHGYTSDRNLNSLGCGCITVQQYFSGIKGMFVGLPYFASWKKFEGLEKICTFYLKDFSEMFEGVGDNKNYREEISAYTKQNHSWQNRIKVLMAMVILQKKNSQYSKTATYESYEFNHSTQTINYVTEATKSI